MKVELFYLQCILAWVIWFEAMSYSYSILLYNELLFFFLFELGLLSKSHAVGDHVNLYYLEW